MGENLTDVLNVAVALFYNGEIHIITSCTQRLHKLDFRLGQLQPRFQALPSCGGTDPGRSWSRDPADFAW
jgi:hypothetical protein